MLNITLKTNRQAFMRSIKIETFEYIPIALGTLIKTSYKMKNGTM